ncbi:alpha/beta fold hydrolase [uncultured Aeromicrobium sp.]|uniref:alpha/beta fold hydrolase n=2 Tax=unclassified Aeromicrobium TaxID=2633570 RepID=UPI00338FB0FF
MGMTARMVRMAVSVAVVAALAVGVATPPASADVAGAVASERGDATSVYADGPGPYEVASTAALGDCRLVQRWILQLAIGDADPRCSDAFPYGFDQPISSVVYYPQGVPGDGRLPVVDFVGGIFSDVGNYDTLARHWASHGFVVTVSSDFVNSGPEMHLLGLATARRLDADPTSPLHDRVDLGRVVLAGHSAGGAAALQAASVPADLLTRLDPRLRVSGTLAVEPGPGALGSTVRTPVLVLAGARDTTVPAGSWPLLTQSGLVRSVPGWFATARTADHFSPVRTNLADDEFAGITTAYLLYRGTGDAEASTFFEGPDYRLARDTTFITHPLNPLRVRRNAAAGAL